MSLVQDIPALVRHVKDNENYLNHNEKLFEIYEGELLKFLEQDLARQLSSQSFNQIVHRLAPINVLKQIIDKLSKIYPPTRRVVDGTDQDSELLDWYVEQVNANQRMNLVNEFFNLFKTGLVQPFVDNGKPKLRPIPSDRFLPFSTNIVDPTEPTHMITKQGKETDASGMEVQIFFVYTADEFIVFDSNGEHRTDLEQNFGVIEGQNPFGVLPFVYVNRSQNFLIPKVDSDTLRMTRLIPVLMSDTNFISMFTAYPILFGIDLDDEGLTRAPNAFWKFKSNPEIEGKPQIGQIKPEGDIDKTINLIQAQFSFWLQTRGIRAGAVGKLNGENFQSGIAKMIDEMDTYADRQKQVEYFTDAEEQLWNLILHDMHPEWVRRGAIDNRALFSPNARVEVNFSEQVPMMSRGDLVADLKAEVDAGFISRKRAIKKLNPRMSDDDIDSMLEEMQEPVLVEDIVENS